MADPNQNYGNFFGAEESGWSGSGYQGQTGYEYDNDNDIAQQQSPWGAGDTAYNTDHITNPYAENPFETNVFDNAYSETYSNPNPTHDYSSKVTGFNFDFELD